MEKIILANGQEFVAAPLGLINNDITKRRKLTFASELGYVDVMEMLSNPDNVSEITYILENGTVIGVYTDCVNLKALSIDIEKGLYTAEFSTDVMERKINITEQKLEAAEHRMIELNAEIDNLSNALVMISMM